MSEESNDAENDQEFFDLIKKDPWKFIRMLHSMSDNKETSGIFLGPRFTRDLAKWLNGYTKGKGALYTLLRDSIPLAVCKAIDSVAGFDFWGTDTKKGDRVRMYNEGLKIDTHAEIASIREENHRLGLYRPIRLLDIGAGNALWLDHVRKEQKEQGHDDVMGVGISLAVFEHLIEHYLKTTARPYLPFKNDSFDMVVSWQAPVMDLDSGHLERLIYESVRVTRPGGRIYIEQPDISRWQWYNRFVGDINQICESVEIGDTGTPCCEKNYQLIRLRTCINRYEKYCHDRLCEIRNYEFMRIL